MAVLSGPGDLEGWLVFERNSDSVVVPDERFGDHQRPEATDGILTVPLKGSGYSSRLVCTWCSLTYSHPPPLFHRSSDGLIVNGLSRIFKFLLHITSVFSGA